MKAFNKTIEISVSVDSIAKKFLNMLDKTEVNREGIAYAAIATALNSRSGLGPLYNALNGMSNDIDGITIGMLIETTARHYTYVRKDESELYTQEQMPVTNAVVADIDIYRGRDCIQIKYRSTDRRGNIVSEDQWVSLSELKLPAEE